MPKSLFENELVAEMEKELRKQASSEAPSLAKAADCLHAALEIFEAKGMQARADQVLQILEKLAGNPTRMVEQMPSVKSLMEAGITQHDMREFSKGNPIAKAKFNLVLRKLGLSDHQISKFLGPNNLMSEEDAKSVIDPNRGFGKIWEWMQEPTKPVNPTDVRPGETLEFKSLKDQPSKPGDVLEFESIAALKKKSKKTDPATKGLTPQKEVKNILEHGHPLNVTMADDCAIDIPPPFDKHNVTDRDIDPDFSDLMDVFKADDFDIDASDDELMAMEVGDDTLEVFEKEIPMDDFEDERD